MSVFVKKKCHKTNTELTPGAKKGILIYIMQKGTIGVTTDNIFPIEGAKKVFAEKFPSCEVPENFVQKITYSAGDSNALIRDLRNERDFRIAVTVTLVATGTDVKPLEVVLFMSDVKSEVLYTQMKGRGCRVISEDKLKEITPNATTKECFYIVDYNCY